MKHQFWMCQVSKVSTVLERNVKQNTPSIYLNRLYRSGWRLMLSSTHSHAGWTTLFWMCKSHMNAEVRWIEQELQPFNLDLAQHKAYSDHKRWLFVLSPYASEYMNWDANESDSRYSDRFAVMVMVSVVCMGTIKGIFSNKIKLK